MYVTAWILLAGFARLAGKAFGVKGSFRENINVLGFVYFAPLYLFVVFDFFLIGPAHSRNLAASQGLYGMELQSLAKTLGFLYVTLPWMTVTFIVNPIRICYNSKHRL